MIKVIFDFVERIKADFIVCILETGVCVLNSSHIIKIYLYTALKEVNSFVEKNMFSRKKKIFYVKTKMQKSFGLYVYYRTKYKTKSLPYWKFFILFDKPKIAGTERVHNNVCWGKSRVETLQKSLQEIMKLLVIELPFYSSLLSMYDILHI